MPDSKEILDYLYGLQRFGIRPGLGRIKKLLKRLGNPQDSFPIVHVAGTNGKGSTAAALESILVEAGCRVGLYTSPHLVRFNERIRINKKDITGEGLARAARAVRRAVEGTKAPRLSTTFFEFTTAMAFLYFKESKVDIAVVETGLGGRLDATNVHKNPLVSIITNVALDHTEHLGPLLSDIAREKAGIIKKRSAVITAVDSPGALRVIKAAARENSAALYRLGDDFSFSARKARPDDNAFDYHGIFEEHRGLKINLMGRHQFGNASCALAAAELLKSNGLDIDDGAIKRGLLNIRWPGRFEVVRKNPLVVLDCAHNPDGAEALKNALQDARSGKKYRSLTLVAGILADKDMAGILSILAPLADRIILTVPQTGRAAGTETLLKKLGKFKKPCLVREKVPQACHSALELSRPEDAVCVTGSIYTVGEAKAFFTKAAQRASR